jgi:hypothetical protein
MEVEEKTEVLASELKRFIEKYGLFYMAAVFDPEGNLRSVVITDQGDDRDDLSEDLCHWYKTHKAVHYSKYKEGELN